MQLKEFSFICPVIESAAVLKAIETVISAPIPLISNAAREYRLTASLTSHGSQVIVALA